MSYRIVVLGAPGAGKGTQAAKLAAHLDIPTISTGALFRQHIAQGTELGRLARSYIDAGNLVPDEVTSRMIAERLKESDAAAGFILDGYPRNLAQAQTLKGMLGDAGLSAVLELDIDPEVVIGRLLRRASIEGRSDDSEEVIRHRMEVYREKTAPLIEYYAAAGLLKRVDADGEIDDVFARLLAALGR